MQRRTTESVGDAMRVTARYETPETARMMLSLRTLTAGLGLGGLRAMTPPAFADVAAPTSGELRRRALWANWRGIADLTPGGGYGSLYGSTAAIPGREFSALATVPGARQPHRVLVQVPGFGDSQRLKDIISRTARLTFHMVYPGMTAAQAEAQGIPSGYVIMPSKDGGSELLNDIHVSSPRAFAPFSCDLARCACQRSGRRSRVVCSRCA